MGNILAVGTTAIVGMTEYRYGGAGVGWVAVDGDSWPSIALVGDSHLAFAGNNSVWNYTRTDSWFSWFQIATKNVSKWTNFAVGGYRVDQISATVDVALSANPKMIIESSITNDLAQAYDIDASIAAKQVYCEKIILHGVSLCLFIAPPQNSATATIISGLLKHREWAYAFAASNKNVYIVDSWPIVVDPASSTLSCKSGYLFDQYHLDADACKIVGDYAANGELGNYIRRIASTQSWFSAYETPAAYAGSRQVLSNPGLLGSVAVSSPGCTGFAPTGWSVSRNSGSPTAVLSVASGDFGQDFVMDFAASASGDSILRQLNPSSDLGNILGKTVWLEFEREYIGCTSGICADNVAFIHGVTNYGVVTRSPTTVNADVVPFNDRKETVKCGPFTTAIGETPVRINLITRFNAASSGRIVLRKFRLLSSEI